MGSFWLAGIGCFFITRRISPMSRTVRFLFAINFCLCAGFIVVVGFPNFARTRYVSAANACLNNLRQIDGAVQQFALEKGKTNGATINFPDDLTPYIKLDKNGKIPSCPKGGVYSIKKVGDVPTCSLSNTVTPAHVLP